MVAQSFKAGSAYIELETRDAKFKRDMRSNERFSGKIGKDAGKRFEKQFDGYKVGEKIGRSLRKGLDVGTRGFKAALKGATALAAGGLIVGSAFGVIVKKSLSAAREIQDLANISGISAERFQEMAFAARQVNVDGDEFSQVLKDMNDRLGDFAQTGAGPLVDFFEQVGSKVGITIESFRNLSSDQALGLYIKTLEEAGVNQQDMTFYMEALAGNSTKLIPLLKNNGAGMKALSKEARNLGIVLEEGAVQKAADADKALQKLGETVKGGITKAIVESAPQIEEITNGLIELTPRLVDWAKAAIDGVNDLAGALARLKGPDSLELIPTAGSAGTELLRKDLDKFVKERDEALADLQGATNPFDRKKYREEYEERARFAEVTIKKIAEIELRETLGVIKATQDARKAADGNSGTLTGDVSSLYGGSGTSIFKKPNTNSASPDLGDAFKESLEAVKRDLEAAKQLFEDAKTPVEEYEATLASLAAVQQNALLLDAAGGAETLSRSRVQALLDLASATDDYEGSLKRLGEQIDNGLIDPANAEIAKQTLKDIFDIEQQALDAFDKKEREKLLLLERELDHKLALARASGNTDEIERLEREIELIQRKNELVGLGVSEDDAASQAERETAQLDEAIKTGETRAAFRDVFGTALYEAANGGGFGDVMDAVMRNAFQEGANSITELLSNLFTELFGQAGQSGSGGGIGGLLGGLGSIFGIGGGGASGGGSAGTGGGFGGGFGLSFAKALPSLPSLGGNSGLFKGGLQQSSIKVEVVEGQLFKPIVTDLATGASVPVSSKITGSYLQEAQKVQSKRVRKSLV